MAGAIQFSGMWAPEFSAVNTSALETQIIPPGEEFLRGLSVISINEFNQEQDRILLITDRAYYRVFYIFKDQKIVRYPIAVLCSFVNK